MIPLGSGRLVCFFAGTWFLLGCGANGTVRTFLPREDIFENEKQLLRTNVLYRRINIDSFHVWSRPMEKSNPQTPPVPLPSDVELSPDVIAAANKLLDRATM